MGLSLIVRCAPEGWTGLVPDSTERRMPKAPRGPFLLPEFRSRGADEATNGVENCDVEADDRRRNGRRGAEGPGRRTCCSAIPAARCCRSTTRMFGQNKVRHILVRHEQGAAHAAEGYARSTGKVGVLLVTSGPGATNAITGLTDALMDSIPLVCITGQVPTHLIGSDAFQECDTTGITRSCTKHNYLVRRIEDLPRILHEAFYVASHGRPGPGRHRHPQGRPVRDRHLFVPAQHPAQDLSAAGQGRPRARSSTPSR